jgi:hypothetical protein
LQGLGPAFSAWEMSFYQQHSIIGNKNTPGVTLLEAQSGARVEEQRLKSNNATVAMLATNQFGKRPRQAASPTTPGSRWCCKVCKHSGHWDQDCWIQHPELKLIWDGKNPEKAAKRLKKASTSGHIPKTASTPSTPPAPAQVHAAMAVTQTRTSNLF